MKAHVIENGVVVNTVLMDSLDAMPNLVEATEGSIGWLYDGTEFTNPSAPTQEELLLQAKKALRSRRNILLFETDWTQIADAPVDKAAWALYRQALRDITTQSGFPHDVNWPTKPE